MIKRALLLLALALAVSLAAAPSTVLPSADWIKRTKERIGSLMGPAHDLTPPPADTPNPFRLPGKLTPDNPSPDLPGPVLVTDEETLARLAATLRFSGLLQIGGVPQVIINQLSYKEGDLVAIREGEQATYLRVVHITPTGLTLGLNKAEQTIHIK